LGATAIAAPLALGGSTRQLSDDESAGALQQESARQQQLQQTRERIARGEDPEVVVREHFQEAERQTGQQFSQGQRDVFRDRLLRELRPPAVPMPDDPTRSMIDNGGGVEDLKRFLNQLEEMSFDLNAPPELETLSGDIDNSVTNTSLDFNVTQNITVPAGTTAEQLAVIRSETRRALEREVNNAARTLET